MLTAKSLVELRGIAQSLDVPDVFQKDKLQLVQAIEMKQKESLPIRDELPIVIHTAHTATEQTGADQIRQALSPYMERGLNIRFSAEQWHMNLGRKTDEGTLSMPLNTVLYCAKKLFE